MWVRIGSFAVKPDQVDTLRAVYNDIAVPRVRACEGNVACLLLEPVAAGEPFVAITVWATKEAGDAYEQSGTAGEIVALVRSFFAGPPTLRSYESSSVQGIGS